MEAVSLKAHSEEWEHQLFALDIEHSPETFALSNCNYPHRLLLSSLAAVWEFSGMPWALRSLLKILAKSHRGHKRKQILTSFSEWCCTREPSPSTPVCPFNLMCWQGAKEYNKKNWALCERLWLTYKWSVACIAGIWKGSISFTGEEYMQHPSTAKLTQRRDGQKIVFPFHEESGFWKRVLPSWKGAKDKNSGSVFLSMNKAKVEKKYFQLRWWALESVATLVFSNPKKPTKTCLLPSSAQLNV